MNFVQLNIEEATLKDRQLNQVQFHLPLKTTKLPNVFNLMESARGDPDLQLEDYSISQMTLDEVRTFLVFLSAPPLIYPTPWLAKPRGPWPPQSFPESIRGHSITTWTRRGGGG